MPVIISIQITQYISQNFIVELSLTIIGNNEEKLQYIGFLLLSFSFVRHHNQIFALFHLSLD
jgi:hypothetical protein